MARAESEDHLQNFRFHVRTELGFAEFSDSDQGEAGFQSVTTPEVSVDPAEYKEGHYTYTRKFPGIPQVSDISMMRGVTKKDTSFFDWINAAIRGGEYRTNLTIYHWHRDGKVYGQVGDLNSARKIECYEAFPMRVKISGDLESQSTEVSLAEVDVSMEYFEVEDAA